MQHLLYCRQLTSSDTFLCKSEVGVYSTGIELLFVAGGSTSR